MPSVWRLPRVSGGVSQLGGEYIQYGMSSPRKRGCFRLAHDLRQSLPSLPRVSGGVSTIRISGTCGLQSSPRKRGCFQRLGSGPLFREVFPA